MQKHLSGRVKGRGRTSSSASLLSPSECARCASVAALAVARKPQAARRAASSVSECSTRAST
eukprot:599794-Rhodomonas_salina.1